MRDYSKVSPQFWHGRTGKALKAKGPEALIVGLYLMTCQHANMLGLYYLSKTYIAVDTGLGLEGACKGLKSACEVGFCHYDEESEMVWVTEMAAYQVETQLSPTDNRCKGIQRDYDSLPENPFLSMFYDKYASAFHMTNVRGLNAVKASPLEAPLNPLRSQEQEQEHEQEQKQEQDVYAAQTSPPVIGSDNEATDNTAAQAQPKTKARSKTANDGVDHEKTTQTKAGSKNARGTRLPEDWILTVGLAKLAHKTRSQNGLFEFTDNEVRLTATDFYEHYRSGSKTKIDWSLAWQSWVRSDLTNKRILSNRRTASAHGGGAKAVALGGDAGVSNEQKDYAEGIAHDGSF